MLADVMGLSREGIQCRLWRGLLPAAGPPATLSPLPCVTRVLLSRVTPRAPDPDVPDVWFSFRSPG